MGYAPEHPRPRLWPGASRVLRNVVYIIRPHPHHRTTSLTPGCDSRIAPIGKNPLLFPQVHCLHRRRFFVIKNKNKIFFTPASPNHPNQSKKKVWKEKETKTYPVCLLHVGPEKKPDGAGLMARASHGRVRVVLPNTGLDANRIHFKIFVKRDAW